MIHPAVKADLLIAIVDETRPALEGGTVDILRKARAAGIEVIVIGPRA